VTAPATLPAALAPPGRERAFASALVVLGVLLVSSITAGMAIGSVRSGSAGSTGFVNMGTIAGRSGAGEGP
jgi:heme/copper-type cytochrome/quinol oxidase subunit 3